MILNDVLERLMLSAALIAAIAYVCGCFNGAVIVSKYILRDDVRSHGSGNAGLTNFHRTFGGGLTAVVILCDVLKAVAAIGAGLLVFGAFFPGALQEGAPVAAAVKYWAGTFCLLGHMFPCMFGFKGGKGILSGGTIAILIDWRVALVVWGGFLVLAALTRYVSLGSCWAGASFPAVTWFVYHEPVTLALSLFLGGMILWKHRENIKRLLAGNENKFRLNKKT